MAKLLLSCFLFLFLNGIQDATSDGTTDTRSPDLELTAVQENNDFHLSTINETSVLIHSKEGGPKLENNQTVLALSFPQDVNIKDIEDSSVYESQGRLVDRNESDSNDDIFYDDEQDNDDAFYTYHDDTDGSKELVEDNEYKSEYDEDLTDVSPQIDQKESAGDSPITVTEANASDDEDDRKEQSKDNSEAAEAGDSMKVDYGTDENIGMHSKSVDPVKESVNKTEESYSDDEYDYLMANLDSYPNDDIYYHFDDETNVPLQQNLETGGPTEMIEINATTTFSETIEEDSDEDYAYDDKADKSQETKGDEEGIQLPEDVIIADEDDSDDGDEYVIEDQFQRPKEAEEENYQDSLWYYDPLIEDEENAMNPRSTSTSEPFVDDTKDGNVQEPVPAFNEGVISVEEARSRKPVPGPKGTIILFTVLILLFIAGIITISIWKNPFRRNRISGSCMGGEDEKRLLDHQFV